jgi:hypothetical protein
MSEYCAAVNEPQLLSIVDCKYKCIYNAIYGTRYVEYYITDAISKKLRP